VVLVVVLVLLVFAGGSWFYSGEIRAGALDAKPPTPLALRTEVLAVGTRSITLGREPGSPRELTAPGTFGLRWDEGYGRLGAILATGPDRVERAFARVEGAAPRAGERSAVDGYAWPADPSVAAGRPAREVSYASPLGPAPAWLVEGRRDTWVILVHGYNAARSETLRALATTARLGYPSLAVSYRNDPGAPRSPDGLRRWGATEWRDLEAATRYALDHGARGVVLAGFSMGGAVVTSFLLESPLASRVRGVVLDSPALDLGEVIDYGVRRPEAARARGPTAAGAHGDSQGDRRGALRPGLGPARLCRPGRPAGRPHAGLPSGRRPDRPGGDQRGPGLGPTW